MTKPQNKKIHNQNYFRVINNVLLFLFILLLPTQLGRHFFFDFSYLSGIRVDYLAPTLYVTDIIAFILIILNIKILLHKAMNRFVIVGFFLLIVNIIFAQSLPLAIYRFIKIAELISIVWIVQTTEAKPVLVVWGLFIGSIVELGLSLFQLLSKHSVQGIFYFLGERYLSLSHPGVAKTSLQGIEFLRPYGTFSHPNSMAGFYLLVYFLLLTHPKFKINHIVYNLTLFVSSLIIFLSFSKLSILVFLFLSVVFILTHYKKLGCKFCMLARFIAVTVISFIFLSSGNDPLSLLKRFELAKNSIAIILKHPFFGTGMGNYLLVQENISQKFNDLLHQPVHNIFLLWIAETGLVGIGVIGIIIDKNKRVFVRGIYIIGAFVLTGLFDHYWLSLQQNFLLMGILWGIL